LLETFRVETQDQADHFTENSYNYKGDFGLKAMDFFCTNNMDKLEMSGCRCKAASQAGLDCMKYGFRQRAVRIRIA